MRYMYMQIIIINNYFTSRAEFKCAKKWNTCENNYVTLRYDRKTVDLDVGVSGLNMRNK